MCKEKKLFALHLTARKILRFEKIAFKVFNIEKSYLVKTYNCFAPICYITSTKYAFFFLELLL